jgi:flagellar motor switch/type III secretory pathway protein FliN
VSESLLDPMEMEAIQAAIRETSPRRSYGSPEQEPTRLALISDDRIAEAARPVLINIASRWVRSVTRALRGHLPGTWQLDVVGAEVIDGATAKEELRGGWVAGLHTLGTDDVIELVLAAHGGVVDIASAKRCGAAAPTADTARAPSAVSLRLFQPAGKAMVDSFATAWHEVHQSDMASSTDLAIVSRLITSQTVVRVALTFAGAVNGRVQLYARPECMVARPPQVPTYKASAVVVANTLANVPIEVIVELGTLRMSLSELRRLEHGATFALQGFVDSRVPVYCGGALKAWAKPVVCRGVLAVQIESVIHDQGIKS